MPVEIKELVIRAVAVDDSKDKDKVQNTSSSIDEEALIQKAVKACVKEVLQILERKKNR